MKRAAKIVSITGSVILALSGAGIALSPAAQAAAESICAPGNSYCWSQPDTGNAIVMTDTTNIASFTPENCGHFTLKPTGQTKEACNLVAVDGACVRAQFSETAPVLLYGCGGSTETSEYWFRFSGCDGYYYWVNVGYSNSMDLNDTYMVAWADVAQGDQVFMGTDQPCSVSSPTNQWIWG
jgi:hypothetical protein